MAWEENSCISLNMKLIAILSRIGVSLYQNWVMDLDRTNRIFYKTVIMVEKRKRNYQELDSLIHSDSFFKTYWSLEH